MHTVAEINKNNEAINQFLVDFPPYTYNPQADLAKMALNSQQLLLTRLTGSCFLETNLAPANYIGVLNKLFLNLEEKLYKTNEELKKEIKCRTIQYIKIVLYNAEIAISTKQNNQETIDAIYQYQERLEQYIKKHFKPQFTLPRPLEISNIRTQYNQAYKTSYGAGCFGFFLLPIKLSLQKKTRGEELDFIEAIDKFCRKADTLDSERDLLKLSAVNLVLRSVSQENYGKTSILAKLLQNRIKRSGQENNKLDIYPEFFSKCTIYKIKVPDHLKTLYKKCVDHQEVFSFSS